MANYTTTTKCARARVYFINILFKNRPIFQFSNFHYFDIFHDFRIFTIFEISRCIV